MIFTYFFLFCLFKIIIQMQNDVQIQQLSRINQQKNERLQKMKMNIEKLQLGMNMSKKFKSDKPIMAPEKHPTTIIDHFEKEYSSTSPINTDKQFNFNSNLFRGITNESQPIIQNGSAVSNFSSVSNINNLLNGRAPIRNNGQAYQKPFEKTYSNSKAEIGLLSEIDSLLERSKKATNLPIKGFEKYLGIIESRQSKNFSEVQEVQSSRFSEKKVTEQIVKLNVEEFKKRIEKLETIPEKKPPQPYKKTKQIKHQKANSSNFQEDSLLEREIKKIGHKKSQLSNFSNNTQMVQSYMRLPPHPPGRATASNLIDRHRAIIQQTFQQKKKLQSQVHNQKLEMTQIDLQLSDDQSEAQKSERKNKIQALLRQRADLREQLQKIQRQLEELQSND